MITAVEARKMTEASDITIDSYLEEIGQAVKRAACEGLSVINADQMLSSDIYRVNQFKTRPLEFSPTQKRIVNKLHEHGYLVKIAGATEAVNEPDGYVTWLTVYHFQVSW